MQKHNGMRPHDVVILLKLVTCNCPLTMQGLADSLHISIGEVSKAMDRNCTAGLVNPAKNRVNKLALREFLVHGLKYVFPPQIGGSTRGIATAHSAPPVNQRIASNGENYVWKYYKGTRRGNAIVPLYPQIPKFIENEPELYELLAIVDTLRTGKKREIDIATEELDKRLNSNFGNE